MVEQCLIDGVLGKAPAGFDREVKGAGSMPAAATICELGLPFNPAPKHGGQFIQITFYLGERWQGAPGFQER